MKEIDFTALRKRMVSEQILSRGITDPKVLEAFSSIPRHIFVPDEQKPSAYSDYPIVIGQGQTISQPYMAALMTQVLRVEPGMSVLEIGTGSGYQTAVLAFLGAEVYTIERMPLLAQRAKEIFSCLGIEVKLKIDDGTLGWLEYAPYDRIIVTAAAFSVPEPFIEQLKPGGKIVIPLGSRFNQVLKVLYKNFDNSIEENSVCECVFVPLIGKYGYKE